MHESFKNILIIKPSSLGDIVMALPALAALHKSFPQAKISWLIRPEFASLLENHPYLNDIVLFDRKFLGKAWFHPRAFASLLSLICSLRRSKFDAVIDLQGLFRTASLAWLSGCKKRFGMTNARELAHIFYTQKVPRDQDCIHVVDYYLKVTQAAGAAESPAKFVLPVDLGAADSVKSMLAHHGADADNYAVLIPGAAHTYKRWPAERFAALADKISPQFQLSIVVTGTNPEKKLAETIKNLANVPLTNLAGLTSLSQLVALLKAARLVVTNDTGPGHIAAALGLPLVMIFGPSNPIRLFPYRRPQTLAAVNPFGRGLKLQSTDPAHAIEAITVDQVFEKVCEQIKQNRPHADNV